MLKITNDDLTRSGTGCTSNGNSGRHGLSGINPPFIPLPIVNPSVCWSIVSVKVMSILKGGNKERTQEPTAANRTSSRSHAVLIVSVKQRQRVTGIHQQVRVGKLFLIDLAGSERAANTQNRGKRMVEGAHINRSLLALGNCINALSKSFSSIHCENGRQNI